MEKDDTWIIWLWKWGGGARILSGEEILNGGDVPGDQSCGMGTKKFERSIWVWINTY